MNHNNHNSSNNLTNATAAITAARIAASTSANTSASAGLVSENINSSKVTNICILQNNQQSTNNSAYTSPNIPSTNASLTFYCNKEIDNTNSDAANLHTTTTTLVKENHCHTPNCKLSHQIGTNLADLSVCWHKMENVDMCAKCGKPFYEANQFSCENCSNKEQELATDVNSNTISDYSANTSTSIWSISDTLLKKLDPLSQNMDELTIRVNEDQDGDNKHITFDDIEQTRKSFQEEFSSLIIKSSANTFENDLLNKIAPSKLVDQIDLVVTATAPSANLTTTFQTFSNRDLIEQIKIFNKYNISKLAELTYTEENEDLSIKGLIKIHWNLKQPIRLESTAGSSEVSETDSLHSSASDASLSFKATPLKDLNEKKQNQTSWDDTYDKSSTNSSPNSLFRSQTVKYRPNKWKRTPLVASKDTGDKTNQTADSTESMFVPSYGSVSSICINNRTTCLEAISILFDKFHISNSPSQYSLYKVYQSGDIKELNNDDLPLIQRLWMGPFNEDKLFIMEKGRQIGVSQEVAAMICLPESLLYSLIEKSKQEELKEINQLRLRYQNYANVLKANRTNMVSTSF